MKKYKVSGRRDGRTIVNNTFEAPLNKFRKYYAFIEIEGGERVFDYIGQFRSEALAHFQEAARINHGRLVSDVHVFK